jgi:hypothetical protein
VDPEVPQARSRATWGTAAGLLALTGVARALRLHRIGIDLPHSFHGDEFQILQTVDLLTLGWFVNGNIYPNALIFVYAAAAWIGWLAAQGLEAMGAGTAAPTFEAYAAAFAAPAVPKLVGRVVSATAGALLVPAVYHLARVAFERRVALLAAAVIAVDVAHVVTSQPLRPHEPAILRLVLAAALALEVVRGRLLAAVDRRRPRAADPGAGDG